MLDDRTSLARAIRAFGFGALLILATGHSGFVVADEISIEPSRDTSIFSENVDNSEGGNASLFVGRISDVFGGGEVTTRRALLGFDLSSIPNGATINSVELAMTVTRNSVRDARTTDLFLLHQLTTDWGEGTVDGGDLNGVGSPADPGDATWSSNFSGYSTWTAPGGDFDPVASASLTNIAIVTPGVTTTDVVWTGPGMISDVQEWVNNPATNYGWIMLPSTDNGEKSARIFASRESGSPPMLVIDYTAPIPEPRSIVTITVMAVVSYLGLRNRR